MRNLKKVLSLALSLVMLLGMMVVGASAAEYKDAASIEYKEAADVLGAINVINGRDDGSFDPKAELNRAEGAAIIYRLIMGGIAKDPTAVSTGFTDVDGTSYSWASGYIAACAQQGILSGVGDNQFNPGGKLSGYAFGKMLLVALGFDAGSQGYTGAGWEGNVFRDAYTRGINVDGVNMAANLTREQAAQMALLTLKATMVDQKPGISINGVVIPGDKATDREATDDTVYNDDKDGKLQFCELYFPDLKLVADDDTIDGFGRPASKWEFNKDAVATTTRSADYTFTAKVDGKSKLPKALQNATYTDAKYWENGDEKTAVTADSLATTLTGNGKTVEVYMDAKAVKKVIVIIPTVATVSADPVTRTSGETEQVRVPGVCSWTNTSKVTGWEDLAKNDVVLVVKDKDNNVAIEKAESVTGVVQGYSSSKGVQVDGTYYTKTDLVSDPINGWNNFKDEYTFYLDASGAVVKAVKADGASDTESTYAVVQSVAWFPGSGFEPDGHMEAKILKTDGEYETVTVTSVDGVVPVRGGYSVSGETAQGKVYSAEVNGLDAAKAENLTSGKDINASSDKGTKTVTEGKFVVVSDKNADDKITPSSTSKITNRYYGATNSNLSSLVTTDRFYSYTVDSDGKYALTDVTGTALKSGNIVRGAARFNGASGAIGNANTVFLFTDKDGKNVQIYTGINNVPSATVSGDRQNAIVLKSSIAQFVYVKNGTVSNESSDVVYIADASYTSTANGRVVNAFVNGEADTITLASSVTPKKGLYTVRSVNDKDVSTLSEEIPMGTGIEANAGGVLTTREDASDNGNKRIFTIGDDTVAFVIEGSGSSATCTQVDPASIEADSNDDIWVFLASGTNTDLADTIYVVKQDIARPALTLAGGSSNAATLTTNFDSAVDEGSTATVTVADDKNTVKFDKPTGSGYSYTVALSGDAVTANNNYNWGDDIALTVPEAGTKTLTITVTVTDDINTNIVETFNYTVTVTKAA